MLGQSISREKNTHFFFRSEWVSLIVVSVIAISRICWYQIQDPCMMTSDSQEYIAFDTLAMMQGRSVNGRAPVYGMFLDLMEWLFGTNFLTATVLIQSICSIASLFVFANVLRKIGIRSPWWQLCVLLYGTSPAVIGWESSILTESFSLSGSVVFLYFVVVYIQQHQFCYGAAAIILTVLLVFLRPQFQIYMALLLVFFVLKLFFPFDRKERYTAVGLLILLLLFWGLVFLYCWQFEKQFDVFSLSDAMPRQNLVVCIMREYYTEFNDSEMAQFIGIQMEERNQDIWSVCFETLRQFGNRRVQEVTTQYFAEHPVQYLQDTLYVILDDAQTRFYGYSLSEYGSLNLNARGIFHKLMPIQMGMLGTVTVAQVLSASLLEGVAMVIVWVRRRTLPWLHMALFSISVCTTYLMYFVTCGEYMRTMVSIIPYFYCMVAMFLQMCSNYSARHQVKTIEQI